MTAPSPSVHDSTMYKCKYGKTAELTHQNYHQWHRDMEFLLNAEGALDIVLGNEVMPAGRGADPADFNKRARKAAAMIHAACSMPIKAYIDTMRDPHAMWNELKAKLDTANSLSGRTAIRHRFNQLRLTPGGSLEGYITQLIKCKNMLAGSEQTISDETFRSHLTTTLTSDYNPIIDIIIHKAPERQTTDYIISTLVEWDNTRQTRKAEVGSNTNAGGTMTSANALTTRTKYQGHRGRLRGSGGRRYDSGRGGKRYDGGRSSSSSGACWYCLRPGHRQDTCFLKKKSEEGKRNRQDRGRNTTRRRDDEAVNASFASVRALTAKLARGSGKHDWIIDSGASHHLCRDREHFLTLRPLSNPVMVHLGDGSTIPATGTGTISLALPTQTITIEALFAPELQTSLLSVSQLSQKFPITFRDSTCLIGKTVLSSVNDGVYCLKTMPVVANAATLPTIKLWHQRLAHLNHQSLKSLIPHTAYTETDQSPALCEICIKANHQKKIERRPAPRTTRPFELIHSDLCGPISPESISGLRYFILYIDDYSRSTWVYFLRSKNTVDVVSVFQEFMAVVEKRFPEYPITRFRCDNGRGEYDNSLFRGILRVLGISFEPSPPYTQDKNGVSERMIRTVVTKARAMLLDSRFGEEFWAEAVNTAVYLHSRSPSRSVGGMTPHEKLYGTKPELAHLRRFGCVAYKLIPDAQRRGKFSERAKKCGFIGYVHQTSKIWRLWDPEGKRIVQIANVRFDETEVIGDRVVTHTELDVLKSCVPDNIPLEEDDRMSDVLDMDENGLFDGSPSAGRSDAKSLPLQPDPVNSTPVNSEMTATPDEECDTPTPSVQLDAPATSMGGARQDNTAAPFVQCEEPTQESFKRLGKNPAPIIRRARRLGCLTQVHCVVPSPGASDQDESDPLSYREALNQSRCAYWKEAMRAEFRSLKENGTWNYLPMVPDGVKPIGCRWVFLLKTNPDGTQHFKARLVIKGYEQVPGIDFGETFAPVAKLVSLRLLAALSALNGWEMHHMDVSTAFLNPAIDNDVYMQLPEGIEWLESTKLSTSTICKLNKALYALKQAPRLWYDNIDRQLQTMGLNRSNNDSNLYIAKDFNLLLLLYVDDILIVSKFHHRIEDIKQRLQNRYQMNDLGIARRFLGLEIERSNSSLRLHQTRFIKTVLLRFGMTGSNGVSTPMETGRRLLSAKEADELVEPGEYQSLIGSLMYLVVGTRPDLAFAVASLSKFNTKPTNDHLLAAKRLLRYLRQTINLALVYNRNYQPEMIGYTDSDFAGDLGDRKSTSGYVFVLAGAAISWKAKKQSLVSLSSTEAEYIGYSEASREAIWLRRLYHEISQTKPVPQLLNCDNQGAIKLSENPRFHERTKHIDIKYHYIRECIDEELVELRYVPSNEMTADIMTKPLPRDTHQRHVQSLGLRVLD